MFTHTNKRHSRPGAQLMASISALTVSLLAVACSEPTAPNPVPDALEAASAHSENLYEHVFTEDWAGATAQADSLSQDLAELAAQGIGGASRRAELESLLATTDAALSQRNRFGTLQGANEMTRVTATMTGTFGPAVPVEITLLDYYGRVLQTEAEATDPVALTSGVNGLRTTWDAIRGKVEKQKNGMAAAADFEALVLQSEATAEPASFVDLSVRILDEVDVLEQLFPTTDIPD